MPDININLQSFEGLSSEDFPSEIKSMPLGLDLCDTHEKGENIKSVVRALGKEINENNVFNLEVVEGIPSNLYCFTLALDKDLQPCLFFGCYKGGEENPSNKLNVSVKEFVDDDGDKEFKIVVGKATIEFIFNKITKRFSSWLSYKKTRISFMTKWEKNINPSDVENIESLEDLTSLLTKLSTGGFSYKLFELCHPDLIASNKVNLPLILEVVSFEAPFHGDGFTAYNINVRGANGVRLFAKRNGEEIEDVSSINVYDYSAAGSICEGFGAAKALLLNLYGGSTQIRVTRLSKEPLKYNPTHTLKDVLPSDPILAKAYEKAKEALKECIKTGVDFMHLMEPSSKESFVKAIKSGASRLKETKQLNPSPTKKATANKVEEPEDDEYLELEIEDEDDGDIEF